MLKKQQFVNPITRLTGRRKFVRHPTHIPIEVWQSSDTTINREQLKNVSLGGVAFESNTYWERGTSIAIRVLVSPPIELAGRVVWCRQCGGHFEAGVEFTENISPDNINQMRQIEMYQNLIIAVTKDIYESWDYTIE